MTDDLERSSAPEPKPKVAWYQDIRDPWHGHPLSNRVGSRRFRRRLVVGTYAGWLVIAAVAKLISLTSHSWFLPLDGLVLANVLVQLVWFFRRTYINIPQVADADLDERLVQVRNQAFRTAYQVFVPVAMFGLGFSAFALTQQPNYNGYINASIVLCGVGLLAGTLPTIVVAWREPDPQTSGESA